MNLLICEQHFKACLIYFRSLCGMPTSGLFSVIVFTLLGLLGLLSSHGAIAQDPVFSDFKKVPIPPSPNVAALGKFGDIPVSPSTGIPSIQIPIYNYSDNQKDLNLNVALSYHAGGHKVEDMASNVGLGWALQAGGVIMRTVKGLPDEELVGYLNTPALPLLNTTYDGVSEGTSGTSLNAGVCQGNSSSFMTIKDIAESRHDGEADMFNISIGEINEKFFFDKSGSVVFVTPTNLKIKSPFTGNGLGFIVTDSKGVTYYFDIVEYTQTDNAVEPSVPAPPMYVSSWYLSKIVSADGKDEILFTYATTSSLLSYEAGLTLSFKTTEGFNTQTQSIYSNSTTFTYNARRISNITFPDKTTVDFFYTYERADYDGDKGLTLIKIANNQYEKSYELKYGYFVSDYCTNWCEPGGSANDWQRRLKLLSVREKRTGQDSIPPYLFEYNTTPLPYRSSKEQDWWGHYNGGATGDIIPGSPSIAILARERIPSLTHCKAWIMERITYPTGGNTRFVYELNEGLQDTSVKSIGGLRVQQREDYDPVTGVTYIKKYSYTMPDGSTSGLLLTIPSYTAYSNRMAEYQVLLRIAVYSYYNESFNPTQTLSYFNGSPVIYKRVKEQQYVNGSDNGYKIYEFEPGIGGLMHDSFYPFVQRQDQPWTRGQPTRTDVYNNLGVLLSREENEYQTTGSISSPSDSLTRNLVVGNYFWDNLGTLDRYLYGARYYYLVRGKTQLIKTTRKDYANGEINQTVTEYSYDNTYYVPTLTKTTNSKGEEIEVRNYYPFNYNLATYPLMDSLKRHNRIAEPVSVETWITKSGASVVRSILVNEYAIVNTNLLKKKKVYLLESDQPVSSGVIGAFNPGTLIRSPSLIKENLTIEKFDTRGRGVQFKYTGDEQKSLIWGDGNEHPIASADNAAFDDIAYTSFECVEKGNWTYTGTPVTDATAPTGTKVYVASNGLSKLLNSAKTYTLTLWRKGSVTISNATLFRIGKTIDSWTYEEYTISSQSSVSFSGSGRVDEVRLFPSGAQMASYTYYNASQLTNQSDANGTVTRFDYDALGRLKTVRDEEKNIVKEMVYHYKLNNQ